MKYQEGGLAEANQVDPATGYLGLLAQQFQTTPEAQQRSREILDELMAEDAFIAEEDILQRFQETAEESRAALKAARERVLADQYDPRQAWLAAGQALGAPTRTGGFGESLGNLAGALREPFAERDAFERAKSDKILELEGAMAGVDENLLMNEFKLAELKRRQMTDLGQTALRTLSKATIGRPPPTTPGIKSLDQKMATIMVEWTTQGQADAIKSQSEMTEAIGLLEKSDNISGPLLGLVPKWARDIAFPESGNVQDLIETTAQRSLKAILGGQFGQREGEMLLARTFNPRLQESDNRRRAHRLLKMLEIAAKEKDRAIAYLQTNGTMAGYNGKTEWSLADFEPEPIMINVNMPDGGTVEVPDNWSKSEVMKFYNESREKKARGGHIRTSFQTRQKFQVGGPVDFEELDDDESVEFEDVGQEPTSGMDILKALGTTGAGTIAGAGIEEMGTRLMEMRDQVARPSRGQQLVGSAMDTSEISPTEAVTEVKRGRRMGVPEVPLDVSGRVARELGERALMASGPAGDVALDFLVERQAGSRDRVARHIEKGLRTPEFHATEARLIDNLYTLASPLYEKAYKDNAAIPTPKWWGEMHDSKYGREAIENALEFMKESGIKIGKENIAGWVEKPNLQFLDMVKRGYDQQIITEEKTGPTPRSRIMKKQRSRLITYLDNPDNVTPTYREARKQYKGDLEVLEALDVGRRTYYRMPSEEARRMIIEMSNAEKAALRTGVAQKMYEIIYAPSTDISAARRLIGSPEMSARLGLLFEKPREFRVFKAALSREMDMFEKSKGTIRRGESGRAKRQIGQILEMDDPLFAIKNQIGRGPTMWVLRMLPPYGSKKRLTENEADDIIRILTTGDIKELERLRPQLDYATEYAKKRAGRRGKAAAVGTAIGAAVAAVGLSDDEEE